MKKKEKIRIQQKWISGNISTLNDYVESNVPSPEQQMERQAKL